MANSASASTPKPPKLKIAWTDSAFKGKFVNLLRGAPINTTFTVSSTTPGGTLPDAAVTGTDLPDPLYLTGTITNTLHFGAASSGTTTIVPPSVTIPLTGVFNALDGKLSVKNVFTLTPNAAKTNLKIPAYTANVGYAKKWYKPSKTDTAGTLGTATWTKATILSANVAPTDAPVPGALTSNDIVPVQANIDLYSMLGPGNKGTDFTTATAQKGTLAAAASPGTWVKVVNTKTTKAGVVDTAKWTNTKALGPFGKALFGPVGSDAEAITYAAASGPAANNGLTGSHPGNDAVASTNACRSALRA